MRKPYKEKEYLSVCTKNKAECQKQSDIVWEHGVHSSECEYRPTAFCFDVENPAERFEHELCTDTMKQCEDKRARTIDRHDPANTTYTECAAYE